MHRKSPTRAPVVLSIVVSLVGTEALAYAPPDAADEPASGAAPAADGEGSAAVSLGGGGVSADADADGGADAKDMDARKDTPWIKRWAPEKYMIELGVFGGAFITHPDHDFYDPAVSPRNPLWSLGGDVGARFGYYPIEYLGIELEGGIIPHRVRTQTNDPVLLYQARGHLLLQLPWWSITPFAVVGAGVMGVRSYDSSAELALLGRDDDPAFHWGLGAKFFVNRWLGFRLDGRHILTAKEATQNSAVSHAEVLAGVTFVLNRPKYVPPPPSDRDGDSFFDDVDACPDEPGIAPDGCPPPPPPDTDGDGFADPDDACPEEPGVEPDGCPIRDTDGDGIMDPDDECIDEPETDNGYKDEDGCPDDIPDEVIIFTGVIDGIEFEFGKAKIRDKSKPILDKAIETLKKFDTIELEISGHTDDVGSRERNIELSKQRADAVKKYLVDGGIDEKRLTTRGAGPDEPRVPNDNDENRAKNRRTEFKITSGRKKVITRGKADGDAPETEGEGDAPKTDGEAPKAAPEG